MIFLLSLLIFNDFHFEDVTKQMGIDFVHQDGRSGRYYYVETTGSGAALLDLDDDGDLDLYLLNGAPTPGSPFKKASPNRLYINENGTFVDRTSESGLGDTGFSMGVCAGDVDGDGKIDLFVTNYGANRLFRNLGGGRFQDITESAGLDHTGWGTNAAMADLDGDQDLDLYVANYVLFDYDNNPRCGDERKALYSYCRPSVFKGEKDLLYINDGTGRFQEQGNARGIDQGMRTKSFGVRIADLNDDQLPDIVVASDGTMNRYYQNLGQGRFVDASLFSGLGYNGQGEAEAGMGLDLGDFDGDGDWDIFATNYARETNTLYRNEGDGFYSDATTSARLATPSLPMVGWGTRFLDLNNDGLLDLFVANGHVLDNIELIEDGGSYAQRNQVFLGSAQGTFKEVYKIGLETKAVSRGLAVGDIDNNGTLDVLITNSNSAPRLLKNRNKNLNHWLGLHIIGPAKNRHAIGAKVTIRYDGKKQVRKIFSGGSFLTQDDLRLHFGLGTYKGPLKVEVDLGFGKKQSFDLKDVNRYHKITWRE